MADTLVIGAGIAGTTYSAGMAKLGYDVVVLEKAKHVGDNVLCGGGFTNSVVKNFPWIKKYVEEYDGRLITEAEWVYGKRKIILPNTDMVVASRNKFDAFLGRKAEEYGAKIMCGEKALKIKQGKDDVTVVTEKGEYTGRIVMDASGEFGPIEGSGLCYKKGYLATLQWEFDMAPEKIDKLIGNKIQLIFPEWESRDIGYAWIFPRKSSIHIGAGSSTGFKGKMPYLQEIIKKSIKDNLPELTDYNPTKKKGALMPNPLITPKRMSSNKVMMSGDAGSGLTGQGAGNGNALGEGSLGAGIANEELEKERICLDKYSEILMPYHYRLAESAATTEKLMGSRILKGIIFSITPKFKKLTEKLTNKIREDLFDAQGYNMLQL